MVSHFKNRDRQARRDRVRRPHSRHEQPLEEGVFQQLFALDTVVGHHAACAERSLAQKVDQACGVGRGDLLL